MGHISFPVQKHILYEVRKEAFYLRLPVEVSSGMGV